MDESIQIGEHSYVLPAVVAIALQTNRPEVLRALKDEAADKLRELPDDEKANMVSELFKLIADLMEGNKKLKAKIDEVVKMVNDFDSAVSDVESAAADAEQAAKEFRIAARDLDG